MARKRMISPEIWESQSFGELSMLAKVLFIGMISQADDDGKGVLSAQLLKSRVLPYDELRIADIDKALREIGHKPSVNADGDKAREEAGHKLSVTYYEVDGRQYYCFDNWRKWQTINRPIPSKLPNPPIADGEGGGIHSHEEFTHNSVSTHTQFSEYSRPKEVLKEKNINNTHTARMRESDFENRFNSFCERWNVTTDSCSPLIVELDFEKLNKAYEESTKFLQVAPVARTISWIIKNASSIYAGKYKDKEETKKTSGKKSQSQQTHDILKNLFDRYKAEEEADDDSNQ